MEDLGLIMRLSMCIVGALKAEAIFGVQAIRTAGFLCGGFTELSRQFQEQDGGVSCLTSSWDGGEAHALPHQLAEHLVCLW